MHGGTYWACNPFVCGWYADAILWSMLGFSQIISFILLTNSWPWSVSQHPYVQIAHIRTLATSARFTWYCFSNWPFAKIVSQTTNILISTYKFWEWPNKVHPHLFPKYHSALELDIVQASIGGLLEFLWHLTHLLKYRICWLMRQVLLPVLRFLNKAVVLYTSSKNKNL